MDNKFCMSYSCGKDSTLALYRLIQNGFTPVALIIAVNRNNGRSWFHNIEDNLINELSKQINIPVIKAQGCGDTYREKFIEALNEARDLGASFCAFGDIDLQEHRDWCEETAKGANLEAVFPLWKNDRKAVVMEFIDSGFKAVIKTVTKTHGVSPGFLNQTLSTDIVTQFEILGIDVCGENGEYHTFVYDGPIFTKPVEFDITGMHESQYGYTTILKLKE